MEADRHSGGGRAQRVAGGLGALQVERTSEFKGTESEETVWPTCRDPEQSFCIMIFENTNIAGAD